MQKSKLLVKLNFKAIQVDTYIAVIDVYSRYQIDDLANGNSNWWRQGETRWYDLYEFAKSRAMRAITIKSRAIACHCNWGHRYSVVSDEILGFTKRFILLFHISTIYPFLQESSNKEYQSELRQIHIEWRWTHCVKIIRSEMIVNVISTIVPDCSRLFLTQVTEFKAAFYKSMRASKF